MATADKSADTGQTASGPLKTVWMAPKLAFRNLFHDILSLAVTLTGIVFSVVLRGRAVRPLHRLGAHDRRRARSGEQPICG